MSDPVMTLGHWVSASAIFAREGEAPAIKWLREQGCLESEIEEWRTCDSEPITQEDLDKWVEE